jgi:hypothetical protein
MTCKLIPLASLSLALLAPSLASAEEAVARTVTMGSRGTIVVGADLAGIVDRTAYESASGYESETWTIGLAPSLDYFVTDHVSLGGRLVLSNSRTTSTFEDDLGRDRIESSNTSYGASLRIGVHQAVSPTVSLWLRAGAGMARGEGESDSDDFGESKSTTDTMFVEGSALVLVHLVPHLFIAAGPGVVYRDNESEHRGDDAVADVELGSDSSSFGLRLEIGGYW